MTRPSSFGLILIAPALAMIGALFLYPLGFSLASAFTGPGGGLSLDAFREGDRSLFDRHPLHALHRDRFDAPDCLFSIVIAGTLTLGETPWLIAALRYLYRWPLFIPFIVAAQCMRTFLAKNGLMNNSFVALGIMEPIQPRASSTGAASSSPSCGNRFPS